MPHLNRKYWNKRKVFVTGHEGFLGSWLTKTLVDCGADVVSIDKLKGKTSILEGSRKHFKSLRGDIANLALIKKIITQYKPQTIFHVAAEAIVGRANKNPIRTFKSNIQGTWNILDVAKNCTFIENIIVASSDKAYGSHEKLPYTEEAVLQGEHPYDVSKSCADLLCRSYFLTFNVPVAVTRCGNIYGPGDFNYSRLVPDAIRHILKDKQFIIRSDGTFTRDYIFVKDVVNAYMVLAEKMVSLKLQGEAFNFSCEKPISVLDLFNAIVRMAGKKNVEPKILNQAKHEIKHQYLTSAKAKKVLGWRAEYSLEEALKETIKWYRNVC